MNNKDSSRYRPLLLGLLGSPYRPINKNVGGYASNNTKI